MHETFSIHSFAIADLSIYQQTPPQNISFEITAPGWNKVNVEFVPNQVNVFTSDDFNIDCSNESALPDGEYTVKYSVSPNEKYFIEKSFFRTSLIRCKYKKAILTLGEDCNCLGAVATEKRKTLTDIRILIEGAIASAEQCDINSAYKKYKLADRMLSRLSSCNC